ncbi:hypothetical protein WN865_00970 [Tetragenococcus halophilus]
MRYKKFFADVFLNSVSNFILVGIVQLVIFPFFNNYYGADSFGEITVVYGLNSIFLAFLGSSLNNVKIIHQEKKGINFNAISLVICCISFLTSIIIFRLYSSTFSILEIIIYSFTTSLGIFRIYLGALFRIRIEYKAILFDNLLVFMGYVLGLILFFIIHIWSLCFFIGEIIGVAYLVKKTKFFEQAFSLDKNKNVVLKDYFNLSFSYGVKSLSNYLDRLLIIPILGPVNMSIFYASNVLSKIIIMIIGQINTVFLSYLMKGQRSLNKKRVVFLQILTLIGLGILFYPLTEVSKLAVKLLYPNFYEKAIQIIPYVTLGALFFCVNNIVKMLMLKYYDTRNQLYTQTVYTVIYILTAIYMSKNFGIEGFALAYLFMGVLLMVLYNGIILFGRPKTDENIEV